jgi:hypothetical protein
MPLEEEKRRDKGISLKRRRRPLEMQIMGKKKEEENGKHFLHGKTTLSVVSHCGRLLIPFFTWLSLDKLK